MIISNYKIIQEIGRGGMGVVYKAKHMHKNIPSVAIKALNKSLTMDTQTKSRFKREATLQESLKHKNIVKIVDYIEEGNSCFIVMDYFKSRTLERMIGREIGPIPYQRVLPLFTQILDGISYAHKKGIIHRDVKPSNILVGKNDIVKLTDFGIAKIAGDNKLTQEGTIMGTGPYMSPEQITGQISKLSNSTDIYSLGVTLYEMLAGRLPFESPELFDLQHSICHSKPDNPTNFYPHIPDYIEKAVLKAIEKKDVNRFHSCEEFKNALLRNNVVKMNSKGETWKIGRASDNNIILKHSKSSRYHAQIIQQDDNHYKLIDLKSRNGTFIGNVKIGAPSRIKRGQLIKFGSETLNWNDIDKPRDKMLTKDIPIDFESEDSLNIDYEENKKGNGFKIWGILIVVSWFFRQVAWQGGGPWNHNIVGYILFMLFIGFLINNWLKK